MEIESRNLLVFWSPCKSAFHTNLFEMNEKRFFGKRAENSNSLRERKKKEKRDKEIDPHYSSLL